MSSRVCRAELAITSEGEVLLNVLALDDVSTLDRVLQLARRQPGAVFVGLALSPSERRLLTRGVRMILPNATAPVAGRRFRARPASAADAASGRLPPSRARASSTRRKR
jgi:hypothetical protein